MPIINICKQCKTKLATEYDLCKFCAEEWLQDFEKCKQSPYYFMTRYWQIDGKPFTTPLSKEQFNEIVNELSVVNIPKK